MVPAELTARSACLAGPAAHPSPATPELARPIPPLGAARRSGIAGPVPLPLPPVPVEAKEAGSGSGGVARGDYAGHVLSGASRRLVDVRGELRLDVTQPELARKSMTALHRDWLERGDTEAPGVPALSGLRATMAVHPGQPTLAR